MHEYIIHSGNAYYNSTIALLLYETKKVVRIKSTSDPYLVAYTNDTHHTKTDVIDHLFTLEQIVLLRNALNYILAEAKESNHATE